MHRRHLALLMERFPALALQAPQFPVQMAKPEDFSSWPGPLLNFQVLYIYGLNIDAYKILKNWLHEDFSRRLIFLEDQEELIGGFLHTLGAEDLLQDGQVEIHLLPKGRARSATLQALASQHPVKNLEVLPLPSRKGPFSRSLRLQLFRKTTLTEAILTDRLHGYQLFFNFVRNAPQLERSFYVNLLKGAFANIPAIICGAGPSLTKAFSLLEKLENKALIFACGSAIAALSKAGISPHFCVAVDPNEEEFFRLKNSFAFEIPFLYSTRIHPHVFSAVNGPFGYLRSQFGDVSQLWLEEELNLTDPLIGHKLSSESISVTTMAIAAAEWFGCNPIVFAGLDMAYTQNLRYSSAVGTQETSKEAAAKQQTASDRVLLKKDRQGKKIYSAVRWVMESSSLSKFAKDHPHTQFINTTDGGIGCKGVPYKLLDELAGGWSESQDLRGLVHSSITSAPLSPSPILPKIQELRQSLCRVIEHLLILSGNKPGSSSLAELEMKEELAFSVLFYDISYVLKHQPQEQKWKCFLQLAEQYLAVV